MAQEQAPKTQTLKPCIVPWVAFATNTFGKPRPCGYSSMKGERPVQESTISQEFNSQIFREVRKSFMAGEWPTNCERCRVMEQSQTDVSKRLVESKRVNNEVLDQLIEQTDKNGVVKYFPQEIDIRLGTVCNLKCIHCGTGNSSKWYEDEELIGVYPNTRMLPHDNSWVDRETSLWKDIFEHLPEIKKFNFIGGEPFASRQHNRFIERVAQTPFASQIQLHYVTNGTLLNQKLVDVLRRFRQVIINVSLDATGLALEFFRFPIKSQELHHNLQLLENNLTGDFDLRIQWTCSNVSIFYLTETLDYYLQNFSKMQFKFCNFVDYPAHMSPRNLPDGMKKKIGEKLDSYREQFPAIDFYLAYMNEKSLWKDQGHVFLQYLEDLSRVRKINWKASFSDFSKELDLWM